MRIFVALFILTLLATSFVWFGVADGYLPYDLLGTNLKVLFVSWVTLLVLLVALLLGGMVRYLRRRRDQFTQVQTEITQGEMPVMLHAAQMASMHSSAEHIEHSWQSLKLALEPVFQSLQLSDCFKAGIRGVGELLGAEQAALILQRPGDNQLHLVGHMGLDIHMVAPDLVVSPDSLLTHILDHPQAVMITPEYPAFELALFHQPAFLGNAFMLLPISIFNERKAYGVFCVVAAEGHAPQAYDLERLGIFAQAFSQRVESLIVAADFNRVLARS